MSRFIDRTGERYGRLLVVSQAYKTHHVHWNCICDCGKATVVSGVHLKTGHTTSCGCYLKQRISETHGTHGMVGTPEYRSWAMMLNRVRNPKAKKYDCYGGRGITVCDRWSSFENFYADMGPRPDGTSIDRIDNNGNYEPSNCRWGTVEEQTLNKRTTHMATHDGVTKPLHMFAKEYGISPRTLESRVVTYGWSVSKALLTPVSRGGGFAKTKEFRNACR